MDERATILKHPNLTDPGLLARIAERLRRGCSAEAIMVYGSVARGEATADSDIDLLVVAPSEESPYWRLAHVRALVRDLSWGLPLAPLVLTPQEFADRLASGDPFMQSIVEEGVRL
jgi:predicted nucleotidyltransferase